ncbi:porin [Paraburkholderia caballeronis]|uniref:Outer membrane protein (Porin) n=1 Tax=Paraburkholderia caballeronis TaxID=416943 RepID=A0A1H7FKA1_9BURK|nr:porin [Paraburkholderia caballeronis]PXW24954.1 putative porin [Paraburkholderia caballeronis]PXX00684.1 putative porin [Paraburkholderia caballeronis]RAJ98747.1 putative porin [Paraburkholderia caballeronis]SEE71589.1 Outer membrane protein (porin) [Paraburkholderia caballeronis]SEK26224.1 Outer membrane protein (porin) [Paraburkholderia caballeronis]
MKKTAIAVALAAAATAAHAQSSVTLYGRIDNGIQYETGSRTGNQLAAESGNWGCSWFGLEGFEDLGGGTRALFKLEGQLNTMTGSLAGGPGALFNRHAVVGMENDRFGTFKMGNIGAGEIQQDSWGADPQLMQRYAISSLVRGRNWPTAVNGGFEYQTPSWNGLQFKGQYELTNNAKWNESTTSQGRSNGLEATYTFGSGDFRVIYDEIRSPDGKFDNVYANSRSILVGGTYVVGPVKFYLGYQHLSAPDATNASVGVTDASQPAGVSAPTAVNHEWVGAAWQVSAATALTAAVFHANANNGNGNATMFTLGGTYNLSKRTFLYTEAGYVRNSSTSNIPLSGGSYGNNFDSATSTVLNGNPNYGRSQAGIFAGIMTLF